MYCVYYIFSMMKVSSAKVVAKPGSQSRFGFVTMRQEKEAAKCIEELNGKELKGSKISVELVTNLAIVTAGMHCCAV